MKSKLIHEQAGEKTYALIFETGDEAMAGLTDFARKNRLGGAHFTAIGRRDVVLGLDWEVKHLTRRTRSRSRSRSSRSSATWPSRAANRRSTPTSSSVVPMGRRVAGTWSAARPADAGGHPGRGAGAPAEGVRPGIGPRADPALTLRPGCDPQDAYAEVGRLSRSSLRDDYDHGETKAESSRRSAERSIQICSPHSASCSPRFARPFERRSRTTTPDRGMSDIERGRSDGGESWPRGTRRKRSERPWRWGLGPWSSAWPWRGLAIGGTGPRGRRRGVRGCRRQWQIRHEHALPRPSGSSSWPSSGSPARSSIAGCWATGCISSSTPARSPPAPSAWR